MDSNQEGGERANLEGANLYGANLEGANLEGANLYGANLYGANLYGAHLEGANLEGANLEGANLYGAHLEGANLVGANLEGANLEAQISKAQISTAQISKAQSRGANLEGANLYGAHLEGAKNLEMADAITRILPDGDLIGYKKCNDNVIVTLQIPAGAKRFNSTGRKCRAEYALVLRVEGAEFGVTDRHGPRTEYRLDQMVHCDHWDDNRWNECSGGIHFFITRWEAENY